MKQILPYLSFLLFSVPILSFAQTDTLNMYALYRQKAFPESKVTSSKIYQIGGVGTPLVIGGLLVKGGDKRFRELRNTYIPNFHNSYDDYLQYLPAVAMVGMKIGGVKSRSSWGRMLVSDAFAVALMATAVNSIKLTADVQRPDGTSYNSFPSGHSATAFMTATMMHKEYGGRSPWYSIGAYTVATATSVGRLMNNRHWLSDVMAGAGIGILTTELGYFLADLIFKEKGITNFENAMPFDTPYRPSFAGIRMGLYKQAGKNQLPDGRKLSLATGSFAGLEGAYFFNPYIGAGGSVSVAALPLTIDGIRGDEPAQMISAYAGSYFSFPLTPRLLAGSKLLAGYIHYPDYSSPNEYNLKSDGIGLTTGLSLTWMAKRNYGMKVFADYSLQSSMMEGAGMPFQLFALGGSLNILF